MHFIKPDWPAPDHVHGYTTTRIGGVSPPPFGSFNLGSYVNDDLFVDHNRQHLIKSLKLPSPPVWLQQVHGSDVVEINDSIPDHPPKADAAFTAQCSKVCVVTTADCLPVLICNRHGTKVAAAHAGWRGLSGGVLENVVAKLNEPCDELYAWLGPAIGPTAFEVSEDVLNAFTTVDPLAIKAFTAKSNEPGKWLANLYLLAKQRLNNMGISHIYGGNHCTFSDEKNFYSYRRDQGITGRMATLIWLSA